jgi:heptosyltransferase-1
MTAPSRILIIRPSALGDVSRTVPVLASLRGAFPRAAIDWVVQDGFEDAVRAHPMLDGLVCFPRKEFAGWWHKPSVARAVLRWARGLAVARYDMVFDCQGLGRSGVMAWATRAPKRVGLRSAREGAWLFYNRRHPPSPSPHTVDEMLWLLECEGIEPVRDLRLYVHGGDEAWWNDRRHALSLDQPYAVMAPTSRWISKRWPIEWWSELLAPLRDHGIERAVVIGAPGEREQVTALIESSRVIDLVGASTVGQTMAVVRDAALVIANDSAPLHMAIGFDTPAIGLYGPTDPDRVGPYTKGNVGRSCAVLRAHMPKTGERINFRSDSLGDSLMRKITPAMVIGQIDGVLAASEQMSPNKRQKLDVERKPGSAGTDAPQEVGFTRTAARRR